MNLEEDRCNKLLEIEKEKLAEKEMKPLKKVSKIIENVDQNTVAARNKELEQKKSEESQVEPYADKKVYSPKDEAENQKLAEEERQKVLYRIKEL